MVLLPKTGLKKIVWISANDNYGSNMICGVHQVSSDLKNHVLTIVSLLKHKKNPYI